MKITLDISLYPLNENFKEIIKSFISTIESNQNISVAKNNISTQISGEYDDVFELLQTELKPVFEAHASVFVIKFLKGDKIND